MFPATELNLHLVRGSIDILLLYNYHPISNIKKPDSKIQKTTSSDLIEVHHQRLTHMLHVWYTYIWVIFRANVGKHSMEHTVMAIY